MIDMRERLNSIIKTGQTDEIKTNKKEITKGIVDDIKNQIQSFKNKKMSEKVMIKSNDFDFEVSKDMLDKFRKNKPSVNNHEENFNQELNTIKNRTNLNINKESRAASSIHNHSNSNTKISKMVNEIDLSSNSHDKADRTITPRNLNQTNNSQSASSTPLNFNNSQIKNSYLEETKQILDKDKYSNNFINEGNKKTTKTFLNLDNFINKEIRTNSIDKKLEKNNTKSVEANHYNNSKHGNYISLNVSGHSNRSNDDKTKNIINTNNKNVKIKDKIKNFVFELEGVNKNNIKTSSTISHHGKYLNLFDNNTNSPKDNYSGSSIKDRLTTKLFVTNNTNDKTSSYNTYFENQNGVQENILKKSQLSNPGTKKFNSNDSLLNSGKPQKSSIIGFEYKFLNKNKKEDDFSANFNLNNKNKSDEYSSTSKLKAEDVRKISSQLRFSSNDDIRKMDESLVDELINLSYLISKMFENKLRIKEFKLNK